MRYALFIYMYIDILITVFLRFSEDSQPLSEDFRRLSKTCAKLTQTLTNISEDAQRFLKIAEDFRGRHKDVSTIHQRIKEQFKRQTL